MKKRILAVSSVRMDFRVGIERFPRDGEENLRGTEREYRLGGRGAATAITLARQGTDCVFCGKVGADAEGTRLKQALTRHGIDARFLTASKDSATDFSLVLQDRFGSCRTVGFPGASALLCREDVEGAFTSYPDGVFLDPEIPENAALSVLDFARDQQIPVITDLSGRHPTYRAGLLDRGAPFEILVLNSERTRYLTDIEPSSVESCLRSVIKLSALIKFRFCVIKLGERGIFVYDNKYHQLITSCRASKNESRIAGDAFSAALASEYLRNGQIIPAVKYADAVAALTERNGGRLDSIPTVSGMREFFEGDGGENV